MNIHMHLCANLLREKNVKKKECVMDMEKKGAVTKYKIDFRIIWKKKNHQNIMKRNWIYHAR